MQPVSALCFPWCSFFQYRHTLSFGLMPIHVSILNLIDSRVLCLLLKFGIAACCPFIGCHVGMVGRTQQSFPRIFFHCVFDSSSPGNGHAEVPIVWIKIIKDEQ